ncbi:MAG: acyl-CoA dehydrogenase family protein [Chloroflexi bacterium]|nr:acyl-CoA dehydrogenase family protein [Chloroflexota bacterium]
MDFKFSDEEEKFREEVREFLRQELPADWDGGAYGEGGGAEEVGPRITKKLAERKWLAMAWPEEYGGLGAPHMRQLIYNEEMSYHAAPGGYSMGVAWVGPAVMLYGSEEQKQRFLPGITSGEDVWCTLYSEPEAGSDLASLQTSAVRDGDDFVINGQKIWTSGAQRSDWGWLAARTDPEAPKHKGISTFAVKMDTPGITVRPLINMAGQSGFSEVFFDNVRIPKENLVGELNRGWYQVAVALDFERSGIQAYAGGRRTLERLVEFVQEHPDETVRRNPAIRHRLADRAVELAAGTNIAYRIPWMQSKGLIPNYEASISKLFGSEFSQRLALTGVQLLGMYGGLEPESKWAPMKGRLERAYLQAVASTIAAGTSEVQRGIIATRGLGLPR